ncbi:MAG: FAD-binding oxidoreductase [Cyclobacteriaceae bacterium]|nr:FAD-binding oxidoreductase [Cyclobacteriaceae bacterium]
MKRVANWGNFPQSESIVSEFYKPIDVEEYLSEHASMILRGAGLSYGDASLSKQILSSQKFNKILYFDTQNGVITAECGATFDDILKVIVPKGWFLPVTPGTKFVTVGGAVAGDVHGKNHHSEGSFCKYVTKLTVMLANGETQVCDRDNNLLLFKTICGGLGLSAIILTVQFRLKAIESSFIQQKNIVVNSLEEMLDKLQDFGASTYSVSWIDCLARGKRLGRGVIMLGEHATTKEVDRKDKLVTHRQPKFNVPFFFPSFLLNSNSVRVFNYLVFNKYKLFAKQSTVHYDPYFYPLDFVRNWNRLYGKRGFLQYQFVIPFEGAEKGLRLILNEISKSGLASFLAVLKALGEGESTLSFPMQGFTLALDFPVTDKIFPFLNRLDKMVIDLGGRIYLVKDARMAPEIYKKGYPNANIFRENVLLFDPEHKFTSLLSQRLEMI